MGFCSFYILQLYYFLHYLIPVPTAYRIIFFTPVFDTTI